MNAVQCLFRYSVHFKCLDWNNGCSSPYAENGDRSLTVVNTLTHDGAVQ